MAQNKNSIDLRMGMALNRAELDALQAARVSAQARIDTKQRTDGKSILTCHESGGGNRNIGHYVGYVPVEGLPFMVNRKLVNLGVNSIHRFIVATALVRFEVFRYEKNFLHALITLHHVITDGNGKSQMFRKTLFRGKFGEIDSRGNVKFPSDEGDEDYSVQPYLEAGFKAALTATRCAGKQGIGCQDSGHFESVADIKVVDLAENRIAIPGLKSPSEVPQVAPAKPASGARSDKAKSSRVEVAA